MNTRSLESMVPKMIDEAEGYFRAWGNEGTVELRKVFSELIILTASSCLMGREIREGLFADRIARIYHDLDGGLTPHLPLAVAVGADRRAPTQAQERNAARKEMVEIFAKIIEDRRAGRIKEDDFLQKIIDFHYRDETDAHSGAVLKKGRQFTADEVTGWLIVLLFAGQHTSSITSTWLGAMLLSNPGALAELRAEQERLCPDEASLNYANLLEMDTMRRSVTETLRLYPPLILLMRKVMKDGFKVGAHTIPKGDVVGLCAPASNLDHRYWPRRPRVQAGALRKGRARGEHLRLALGRTRAPAGLHALVWRRRAHVLGAPLRLPAGLHHLDHPAPRLRARDDHARAQAGVQRHGRRPRRADHCALPAQGAPAGAVGVTSVGVSKPRRGEALTLLPLTLLP